MKTATTASRGCAFAVALGASLLSGTAQTAELKPWTESRPPGFTLPNSRGGTDIALDSRRGRIVLVHFFATWCEPCRDELPALHRLLARAGDIVTVVAVSVDEPDLRVRRFLQTMPLDFPVLLDRDRAVAKAWNISTLPSTVVLDARLQPRLLVESDFAWDTLDPARLTRMTAHPQSLRSEMLPIESNAKPAPQGG